MASINNQETRIKQIESSLMTIKEFNKTLTVTAGQWTDTGIKISTGTYIVKINISTSSNGGSLWSETFSGICSCYDSGTNSGVITEIPLTNAGHASNGRFITFGFKRVGGNTGQQCFVISANESFTDCPIRFYFRKVL